MEPLSPRQLGQIAAAARRISAAIDEAGETESYRGDQTQEKRDKRTP